MRLVRSFLLLVLVFFLVPINSMAAGDKYRDEARPLSKQIYEILISGHVCGSQSECDRREILFGDHDSGVNFYFYTLVDKEVISKILEASLNYSDQGRVPVSLRFYKESKRETIGLKGFYKEPMIKMEINI